MCTLPLRSAVLTVFLAGAILSEQLGVQGAAAKWQFELAQHDDDVNKVDGVQLPRRRYSHSATVVGSEMVVTHGYFFDHTGGGGATWIDDTWAFTLDGGENQKAGATSPSPSPSPSLSRWREVKDTTANAAATTKPHARMSHTAVERDGKLVLFGGDDGGHLKGNSRSYKGTYLDDLWELDVTTGAWSEIKVSSGDVPPPRAHHAAVVLDGKMVVYAGMHLDDVWNFDFESRQWSILYKGACLRGLPACVLSVICACARDPPYAFFFLYPLLLLLLLLLLLAFFAVVPATPHSKALSCAFFHSTSLYTCVHACACACAFACLYEYVFPKNYQLT